MLAGETKTNDGRTTSKGIDRIGLLLRLAKLVMDKAEHGDEAAQSFYKEAQEKRDV